MSERPIIFSTPMVLALLAGRKTQTRRLACRAAVATVGDERRAVLLPAPWQRVQPGDRLWVRESLCGEEAEDGTAGVRYIADGAFRPIANTPQASEDWLRLYTYRTTDTLTGGKPVPSIHMPRWASRITLAVTGATVQRLQDITEQDAKAEGLACLSKDQGRVWKWGIPAGDGLPGCDDGGWPWTMWCIGHRPAFAALWDSLHGPGAWEANPEVVRITFVAEVQP